VNRLRRLATTLTVLATLGVGLAGCGDTQTSPPVPTGPGVVTQDAGVTDVDQLADIEATLDAIETEMAGDDTP